MKKYRKRRVSKVSARDVLTMREAGDYLRVNRVTLTKLLQLGQLPAFKVGKQWRFKRDRLDRWIEAQDMSCKKRKSR